MKVLNHTLTIRALRLVGEKLATAGVRAPLRVVVAGGSAGLLAGLLSPTRTTADCDVIWADDTEWSVLSKTAERVARELGLAPRWLNRDCSHYAWCLPLGWLDRCQSVGVFGPLSVDRLSRIDFIATKVIGASVRPQDLEDLRAVQPTSEELKFIDEHLDRLKSEHLDGRSFDPERTIVAALRGAP